jgi:hypothetical protein
MTIDTFSISGDNPAEAQLYKLYNLVHHSDVGIKYQSSDSEIKITYSDRIVNYASGRWRMSLNRSPFTSYYVNSSTTDNLPLTGWIDINGDSLTGKVCLPSPGETYTVTQQPSAQEVVYENETASDTTLAVSVSDDYTTPTEGQIFIPSVESDDSTMYSNELTETVKVYARPTVTFLSHNNIITGNKYTVLVTGYSLQYTTNVYLSSNADLFPHKLIDTHNDPEYPPISACETSFDIVTENELIVNIPAVFKPGMIDIVISNPAGYGKLTPVYTPTSNNWTEENLQPYIITVDL